RIRRPGGATLRSGPTYERQSTQSIAHVRRPSRPATPLSRKVYTNMLSELFGLEPICSERALALRRIYAKHRADIRRRLAALTQRPLRRRLVALCQALTLVAQDEPVMTIDRLGQVQQFLQEHMQVRRVAQILAADHVGYALQCVVPDARKM